MILSVPRASHPLLRGIGSAIRSLRRQRGLSQESLAGLADIDRSYMSSVERGLRNVSVLNIFRIAEALGVPVWELFRPRSVSATMVAPTIEPDREVGLDPLPVLPGKPVPPHHLGSDWEPRYLSLG